MSLPASRQALFLYGCLFLSGSTGLVYQLIWTRIFSFSFGSTSLAFTAVLAVFFLGLAGGSLIGGRLAHGLKNPLRSYGQLELTIGVFSVLSFPLLFQLHYLFRWINAGGTEPLGILLRFMVAGVVLSLPTAAMGATLPILLEHVRRQGKRVDAGIGWLYGMNT